MGFWYLFEQASMPILQVLVITLVGAFMATDYCKIFPTDARRSLNKIVFVVFTPSLMFASLAKTVTLEDIISWWFMPINIGLTFLLGGIIGWILTKVLRTKPHLEGLIIAACSSGNLGNLVIIIVPAICDEEGGPFGKRGVCKSLALSYSSFSMALGGLYIWTYTYHIMKSSAAKFKALEAAEEISKAPNKRLDADAESYLLEAADKERIAITASSESAAEDQEDQAIVAHESGGGHENQETSISTKLIGILHQILEELMAPPTLGAILGLIFGAVEWLKNLIVGDNAPLRVIQDSIKLLGDGTIPCITLIMGGNLTQGLKSSGIRPIVIISVILAKYVVLPAIGIWVVKAADNLGFLPPDPLYRYVLMIQFAVPPAMNLSTMAQLFDVGQEECSVILLWTYLAAAIALTLWSTVYMWILS